MITLETIPDEVGEGEYTARGFAGNKPENHSCFRQFESTFIIEIFQSCTIPNYTQKLKGIEKSSI